MASTTFPKAPAPRVLPNKEKKTQTNLCNNLEHFFVKGSIFHLDIREAIIDMLACFLSQGKHQQLSLSALLQVLTKPYCVWPKSHMRHEVFTLQMKLTKSKLTKTQSVSRKFPFVIIRKLRWVYVNIVVSIYFFNNFPLNFIFGFLEKKENSCHSWSLQRQLTHFPNSGRGASGLTCKYMYTRITTMMHISPAATPNAISKGVKRVWVRICSGKKQKILLQY